MDIFFKVQDNGHVVPVLLASSGHMIEVPGTPLTSEPVRAFDAGFKIGYGVAMHGGVDGFYQALKQAQEAGGEEPTREGSAQSTVPAEEGSGQDEVRQEEGEER